MAAYAVKNGPVIRPDQMERNCRESKPELPRRIGAVSSSAELSLRLANANPVWSVINSANPHSYWPFRYMSDPNSLETFWHDPHSLHSALVRKDLFGKHKPQVDYIANNHFWAHPYPHWARHRGYLFDYANPNFYAKEYDLNYFEC